MRILAMILAGGEGSRLWPLTRVRSKPAVQFGGKYRIIDFVLNNLVNSGIYKIKVLTQFKSNSLIRHLQDGWNLSRSLGQFIDPVPAQMQTGSNWYRGTADAIRQNQYLYEQEDPDLILIFSGDHIYKMQVQQMIDKHLEKGADVTISTVSMPKDTASQFGVVGVDEEGMVNNFQEKPAHPQTIPGSPNEILASMGNYIFSREALDKALMEESDPEHDHDFGNDIIPRMIDKYRVAAYDFRDNEVPGMNPRERGYWRDVGTIDAYYEASMDLRRVDPIFNLYCDQWPIRTLQEQAPPAKFLFADHEKNRAGVAYDSIVSDGCIVSGSKVRNSVLSPNCFLHSYSEVESSILMSGVEVGRRTKIRRTIVDKYVKIPPDETIGYDLEKDAQRYHVTDSGIVVIAKHTKI